MTMSPDWSHVRAARLPLTSANALAALRARADVRWMLAEPWLWLRFPAGELAILRQLQPIFGIEFFQHYDGTWLRFGQTVPTSTVPPSGEHEPLTKLIQPSGLVPRTSEPAPAPEPVLLRLHRSTDVHPTTALRCRLIDLEPWINSATTWELTQLRGAWHDGEALLLGQKLPLLTTACHYWGTRVLRPLGHDVAGGYPEATLLKAAGATAGELLIVDEHQVECVPEDLLQPLTRAGLRRALAG